MSRYIQNFLKFRPLLSELVSRDIKIKYRRSVLGVLWTLLNPLLMMIILSVVFSNLFKFDVENFPLYLLSGQIVFNFYSEFYIECNVCNYRKCSIDQKGICTQIFVSAVQCAF